MPARALLRQRLGIELNDEALARTITDGLSGALVADIERFAGGDMMGSSELSFRPATTPAGDIDSLLVFAFGYRLADGVRTPPQGEIPPMDALVPGPVNEALAHAAATFAAQYQVPIVAQWENARVLDEVGVEGFISVEPDIDADGTVTYLSTAGVAAKAARLAAEAGVDLGRIGVVAHADHVARCWSTARAAGLEAYIPDGLRLPDSYDLASAQPWTRSRGAYIPTDLYARTRTLS